MSKRAEERGLEALPPRLRKTKDGKGKVDSALPVRKFYIRAYEQAEEDLALTIADIYRIHVFLCAVKNNKRGAFTFQKLKDEQYQEVLDRFNKAKEDTQ